MIKVGQFRIAKSHVAELDKTIKATKLDNSFNEAWRLFHDSFENNGGEVLDAIHAATTVRLKVE